ncbi:hypothetical protein GCM10022247_68700 [Allokutzneria multivorans]|uniref:Uncharacterized protein n=1 Tax=Allokutzneria multivorans TaxID=1142134 RepID=A0ABP7U089_9PSEU
MGAEGGLDLAEFDAEAADLDLVVGAAEVLKLPGGRPAHEVAGGVHARAGAEGVGHESRRGQAAAVEVAARDLGAGEVQLTGDAGRHGPEAAVQHVGLEVAQGAADHRAGAANARGDGVDGDLCGAVEVVARGPVNRSQLTPQGFAQRLAAEHEDLGLVRAGEQACGDELLHVGRGEVEEVDAPGPHVGDQRVGVEPDGVLQQVQLVAVGQQDRALPRGVEGEHRGQRHPEPPATGVGHEVVAVVEEQVHQVAVLDDDSFGQARRPRGEDDVRALLGLDRHVWIRGGKRVHIGQIGRAGHEDHRVGVGQHRLTPRCRKAGVDRQVHRSRLEHREDRDDHLRRARQAQRDHALRPGSRSDQLVRQAVRALVQLLVGQLVRAAHERGLMWTLSDLRFEQLDVAVARNVELRAVPLLGDPRQRTRVHQRELVKARVDRERFEQRGQV